MTGLGGRLIIERPIIERDFSGGGVGPAKIFQMGGN